MKKKSLLFNQLPFIKTVVKHLRELKLSKLSICLLLIFFSAGLYGQQTDDSGFIPDDGIFDDAIVYLKLSPKNEAEDDIIDAGVALSEPEIAAWGDYTCYIRFSNVNKDQYIDARDQGNQTGDFQCLDTINFEFDVEYHCWMEIFINDLIYYVYVLVPDETEPRLIAEQASFRKQDIVSLVYYTAMHNPDNSQNRVDIMDIQLVDQVGDGPSEELSIFNSTIQSNLELNSYPNPFSSRTVISYQLPVMSNVELSVYDLLGQKVTTLVKERQQPGSYEVEWNAERMKPGIYWCELRTSHNRKVMKMILLRE